MDFLEKYGQSIFAFPCGKNTIILLFLFHEVMQQAIPAGFHYWLHTYYEEDTQSLAESDFRQSKSRRALKSSPDFLIVCFKEALIKSVSPFILGFSCNAGNGTMRISS